MASPAHASPSREPVSPAPPPVVVDWPTFGFDVMRTGFNPDEALLTPRTVPALKVLWKTDAGGAITGSPVVATGVEAAGTSRDVLYVGTEHGEILALDVADGAVLWRRNVGSTETSCQEFPNGTHGVTGSLVIDREANRLYGAGGDGRVYGLDLSTGAVAKGWPVEVTRDPARDHMYGAITLWKDRLYAATAGICEPVPYRGKLVAIDLRTPRVTAEFYPTGRDGPSGGGIWGVGGASVDPSDGDVYVTTGNARTHPEHAELAEKVVRLTSSLRVRAANYPGLTGVDSDFGATPLLYRVPGCPPQLAVENKDGELFVYDRGHITRGPVQALQVADAQVEQLQGVPAFSPPLRMLFVTNPSDADGEPYRHGVLAFRITPRCRLDLAWQRTLGPSQAILSPPTVAGGVAYYATGNGKQVFALDAENGRRLWDSGRVIRGKVFAAPVVANGRVYVVSWDGRVYSFGAAGPA